MIAAQRVFCGNLQPMTTTFDPWTLVKTANGFAADEVISALQKEIRRGHAENACLLAHELSQTSSELERKLWDRLCVISVEDIGFGETNAPMLVQTLWQMASRFGPREGDRYLFSLHAVRYLCQCQKDRSTDEMINYFFQAKPQPVIPDYAVDMHTARGQAMGRGPKHFWEEGAKLQPELAGRDTSYLEKVLALLN